MRMNKIKQLVLIAAGVMYLLSCSNDMENGNPIIDVEGDEATLNIQLRQDELPDNLRCVMYIFSKENMSDSYLLKDSIHLDENHRRTLPFITNDWNDAYYRFLFIAMPAENAGITLSNHTNTDLIPEVDTWGNVRLTTTDVKSVSGDYYFGVLDKTSGEISGSRLISGNIKRMAGQMVLDIYRVDDSLNPMDKVSASIASVIDRVYRIDFEYESLTDQISFDDAGEPVMNRSVTTVTLDTLNIILDNDLLMNLTDNDELAVSGEGVSGSVRIKGLFCLPSEDKIKVKVIFHYYDTTPKCGNTDDTHTHSADNGCFPEKSLILNLPQNSSVKEYLNVLPNYYTVNKGGIWLDRIIDLKYTASFELNTVWVNENVESNP